MTSIRPADDADMAAVAELWHAGWHDAHPGHVPDGLTAVRTLTAFHERTPLRVPDTTVAVSADGGLLGFVMVVGDEVESRSTSPPPAGAPEWPRPSWRRQSGRWRPPSAPRDVIRTGPGLAPSV